jgi:hypothetical protein
MGQVVRDPDHQNCHEVKPFPVQKYGDTGRGCGNNVLYADLRGWGC